MYRARSSAMRIGRVGLSDRVHEKLKELILDQKLGPGTYLNIDRLCRELDVSSSPLREALARLSAERLVRFEPFIGYAVAEVPDKEYYMELRDVRLLLECEAARCGASRPSAASITAMEQALRNMEKVPSGSHYKEYRVFSSWDAKFHQALVESAGNRPLLEAYLGLHVHLHVARLYVLSGGFNAASAIRDHSLILEAFKAADPERAAAAVRNHLENVQVLQNQDVLAKLTRASESKPQKKSVQGISK
jgi:DNA-binding GntR family transcriptional regulator